MSEAYNQKVKDITFLVRGAGDHINEQTVDLILRFNAMLDDKGVSDSMIMLGEIVKRNEVWSKSQNLM